MNIDMHSRCKELAVFADLGTEPPRLLCHDDRCVIKLSRAGEVVELEFCGGGHGKVLERRPESMCSRAHASYRALLASDKFGDLGRWAAQQRRFLDGVVSINSERIKIKGYMAISDIDMGDQTRELDIDGFDVLLVSTESHQRPWVRVVLIDGPAGVGKTEFIRDLALKRAQSYLVARHPLILHVQSRGRVLTFLQDLIAFSLQQLRLSVTFDQLPILVRHGLVTLAVDGFDELADPNGYDSAWSQVNDIVGQVRGEGTVIFAGRDSFIGRERVKKSISALTESDLVGVLTLLPPRPSVAKRWLGEKGWKDADFDSVEGFFEEGSYMLRPFFLAQLARPELAARVKEKPAGSPLAFLVDQMIEREADKFGSAVEVAIGDRTRRIEYIRRLLQEVASHLADEQTESVDEIFISWLVEVALPDRSSEADVPQEIIAILKHRALAMVFLENDDRPNYRKFTHSQIYNHFLGEVTINAVKERRIPKFIRRNIFGADFLSAFSDLALHIAVADTGRSEQFFVASTDLVRSYSTVDRGGSNLSALLLAMLPAVAEKDRRSIEGREIDEALIQGTATEVELVGMRIRQLDVRGADISKVKFRDSNVEVLIGDYASRVSLTFPKPVLIQDFGRGHLARSVLVSAPQILEWMETHRSPMAKERRDSDSLVPVKYNNNGRIGVLERACRNRSHWIPADGGDEEHPPHKFVRDPHWKEVLDLLGQHELVREKVLPVAGRKKTFFHIKQSQDILMQNGNNDRIRAFYADLVKRIERDL